MLLAPRRSLDLALLLYSFVEDTFTQERGSKKGYLLFFLYFSSCSIYLLNILDLIFTTESIFFNRILNQLITLPLSSHSCLCMHQER